MNQSIMKAIEAIAADVQMLAQSVLKDNSLSDSSLYGNMKVEIRKLDQPVIIDVLFDNYIGYIEQGRKPGTGKKPPVDALRDWALARGIPADNSTLWAISTAIQRDGYEGRPILSVLEQKMEECFEREWADMLYDAITEELTDYFN